MMSSASAGFTGARFHLKQIMAGVAKSTFLFQNRNGGMTTILKENPPAFPSSVLADSDAELVEQHLIRAVVQLLEERCRHIVSMIYLCERTASYAEVAAAIGVGESSISPLRSRGLKKLEKLLTR